MRTSAIRGIGKLCSSAQVVSSKRCRTSGARWISTPSSSDGHQWSTPLAKQLAEAITTTGPIPVAAYMRQCLTSDLGGYYTATTPSPQKDQFGAKGDFVTSPEISQVFGELIGVWVVAEWIAQGRRADGVYLMEVGPGRGTLMADMLRTIRNFPPLANAIEAVYMVEASANLRASQHKLLCGDHELRATDLGHESTTTILPNVKIIWTEDIRFVPREASKTPFIIAHEFFDALPIHIFQSVRPPAPTPQAEGDGTIQTPTGPITPPVQQRRLPKENQWREMLVSPRPPHRLKAGEEEFDLTLAKAATAHSMYLPETSSRYKALRHTAGATIEISPESQAYARDFAIRLGGSDPTGTPNPPTSRSAPAPGSKNVSSPILEQPLLKPTPSGAALIIDYGPPDTIPTNSLRGIRAHARLSPLDSPGITDVSADVDFLSLAETAITASPGVEVHGPVDQARFLTAMGIEERAAQLVKRAVDLERGGSTGKAKGELTEVVKRVESGWKRLVDRGPTGMGRLYQVMAIVPYIPTKGNESRRRPVGFGGDVNV